MRRKNRTRDDIIIDLTSLLDVIFLVLLVVIVQQKNITAETQTAKAENEIQKALYEDMLDTAGSYDLFVSVYSRYDEKNPVSRTIYVQKKGEEKPGATFELNGNDVEGEMKAFKDYLTGYIEENPDKPVILSLNENDDDILYRDEKAIQAIYDELNENPNVYIK